LIRVLIWAVVACATTACSDPPRESVVSTYEKLSELVFSRSVATSAVTDAFIYKDLNYPFQSLQDINLYNRESAHRVDGTAQRCRMTSGRRSDLLVTWHTTLGETPTRSFN